MTETDITLRIAHWPGDRDALSSIRRQVFIEEQNVPEDMEWDEYDAISTHYLASVNGQVIATARLKPDGQIGRMAVLPPYRNQGIGSKLLAFILQDAASKNITRVYLHAQVDAIRFYEKQQFTAQGEIFYEANIPHREMLKNLC